MQSENNKKVKSNHNNKNKNPKYDFSKSFAGNMQSDISEDCSSEVDYDELMNFIDNKAKKSKPNFFDYWSSPNAKIRYPNLKELARSFFIHSFKSLYIERCFSRCKRILMLID